MTKYFITGIGTGVGKSVVSAALTHHFDADYWKPVQCGDEEGTDSAFVLNSGVKSERVHQERYFLKAPQSPHFAADLEGKRVDLDDFELPYFSQKTAIIEGAGGILVPLNHEKQYVIDFASKFDAEVILVVRHYLGSINHSLLSIDYLKRNGYKIKGIVISGPAHEPSESVLLNQGVALVGRINEVNAFDKETLLKNLEWYGQ